MDREGYMQIWISSVFVERREKRARGIGSATPRPPLRRDAVGLRRAATPHLARCFVRIYKLCFNAVWTG